MWNVSQQVLFLKSDKMFSIYYGLVDDGTWL